MTLIALRHLVAILIGSAIGALAAGVLDGAKEGASGTAAAQDHGAIEASAGAASAEKGTP